MEFAPRYCILLRTYWAELPTLPEAKAQPTLSPDLGGKAGCSLLPIGWANRIVSVHRGVICSRNPSDKVHQ